LVVNCWKVQVRLVTKYINLTKLSFTKLAAAVVLNI